MNPTVDGIGRWLDRLRPCAETVLLARFALERARGRVLDIGCGNGYLALSIAARSQTVNEATGVDIGAAGLLEAEAMADEMAAAGIRLAPARFIHSDILDGDLAARGAMRGPFDLLVCNPPFFEPGRGRESPDAARRDARHGHRLSPERLFEAAARFGAEDASLCLVYPCNRTGAVENAAAAKGFRRAAGERHPGIRKRDGGVVLLEYSKRVGRP